MNQAIEKGKADGLEKAKADPAQQKLLNDMIDAVRPTLTAETLDMALSIQGPFPTSGGEPTYAMASALAVKGGKKIEAAILEGIKKAPEDQKKKITLNAAKAADGTTIHKLVDMSDGKDAAPFGESTGYLAFRDDAVAVGVGKNGLDVLNQALAASKAPVAAGPSPQAEFFISASRLAGIAKTQAERDTMKAAASAVFVGPAAKKDRLGATLQATGDAMTLRIGGDVPALKFLGKLGELRQKPEQ
jgi:hypothetical protein